MSSHFETREKYKQNAFYMIYTIRAFRGATICLRITNNM